MARIVIQHVTTKEIVKEATKMAIERNENRSEYINIAIENQLKKDRKKFFNKVINSK